jgi:SAM-dependent methyltransferase
MHLQPRAYVQQLARTWPGGRILEIGSRDVNGSVRSLFQRRPPSTYLGIDLVAARGVDVMVDARQFATDDKFDLVLCLEVFEHCLDWLSLVACAWYALRSGGRFVVTCAGPGRAPHGAAGGLLLPGEEYGNVALEDLHAGLTSFGFRIVELFYARGEQDVLGTAQRP